MMVRAPPPAARAAPARPMTSGASRAWRRLVRPIKPAVPKASPTSCEAIRKPVPSTTGPCAKGMKTRPSPQPNVVRAAARPTPSRRASQGPSAAPIRLPIPPTAMVRPRMPGAKPTPRIANTR